MKAAADTNKFYIEKVTLGSDGHFLFSDILKPTKKQIKEFLERPCDHSIDADKLIYDEWGWLYDSRFCAKCGEFLDFI